MRIHAITAGIFLFAATSVFGSYLWMRSDFEGSKQQIEQECFRSAVHQTNQATQPNQAK